MDVVIGSPYQLGKWWYVSCVQHISSSSCFSPQHFICLYLISSYSVTPTLCMSFFTTSMNLLCCLPLLLLSGSSIFSIFCPIYPLSFHCTCPNHLNLNSLTWSSNCSAWAIQAVSVSLFNKGYLWCTSLLLHVFSDLQIIDPAALLRENKTFAKHDFKPEDESLSSVSTFSD